jgi:hypothetical protein
LFLYGDRSVMVNTLDCGSGNASSILVGHPTVQVYITKNTCTNEFIERKT